MFFIGCSTSPKMKYRWDNPPFEVGDVVVNKKYIFHNSWESRQETTIDYIDGDWLEVRYFRSRSNGIEKVKKEDVKRLVQWKENEEEPPIRK